MLLAIQLQQEKTYSIIVFTMQFNLMIVTFFLYIVGDAQSVRYVLGVQLEGLSRHAAGTDGF